MNPKEYFIIKNQIMTEMSDKEKRGECICEYLSYANDFAKRSDEILECPLHPVKDTYDQSHVANLSESPTAPVEQDGQECTSDGHGEIGYYAGIRFQYCVGCKKVWQ